MRFSMLMTYEDVISYSIVKTPIAKSHSTLILWRSLFKTNITDLHHCDDLSILKLSFFIATNTQSRFFNLLEAERYRLAADTKPVFNVISSVWSPSIVTYLELPFPQNDVGQET